MKQHNSTIYLSKTVAKQQRCLNIITLYDYLPKKLLYSFVSPQKECKNSGKRRVFTDPTFLNDTFPCIDSLV